MLVRHHASSLDAPAQRNLVQVLTKLAMDHTVILVTHRPSLLTKCGYIVVLEHGVVNIAGPADKVLPKLLPSKTNVAAANKNEGGADEPVVPVRDVKP